MGVAQGLSGDEQIFQGVEKTTMKVGGESMVWQIGGGPADRDNADVFLAHDVALLGPGDAGKWSSNRDDKEFGGSFIRHFADDLHIGDVILLRSGVDRVRAVGIVASEYQYFPQFDDLRGWDLQHGRRVRWCKLELEYPFATMVFGARPSRFSGVGSEEVRDFAYRFVGSPPSDWKHRPLKLLPDEEPRLPDENLPAGLRGIIGMVGDLYPLYWDRALFGDEPSEHEMVGHFVIPFLRALGWRPEHIGIEWKNTDVMLFSDLPRSLNNCQILVEAKRLTVGAESALGQARGYLERLGIERDIVVTDGIRYRLYLHTDEYAAVAYANLSRLRVGAMELFRRLRRD